jgi:hypothetical protein
MNDNRVPRSLFSLAVLASLAAVFAGGSPPAFAAPKGSLDMLMETHGPVSKATKQKIVARLTSDFAADKRKVNIHERDKSASLASSERAVAVSESGDSVEHFVLIVTAVDDNGDHKAEHYHLSIAYDGDGDGDGDEAIDQEDADDDGGGLLEDLDTMEHKVISFLTSRSK